MKYADGGGLTPTGRRRRETVRVQAAELFEQQIKPLEVARRLRVSVKSAYWWHQLWRDGGVQALASRGPSGLRCRLSPRCLEKLPRTWSRARRRMAGWRTRCGPHQGAPL
ncbi:helix-turn-helix domain-containing protein [Streptomyces sp. NPDC058701]|uniref:helix-turn-helix domain-containing protein n=1 Tax=Streptomyces sp. NPDC058701 TaxID=3346608 RepID=UPI00365157CA